MKSVSYKFSARTFLIIVTSIISFMLLYGKALNRYDCDPAYVCIGWAFFVFLVDLKRKRKSVIYRSDCVAVFVGVMLIICLCRYVAGVYDAASLLSDLLMFFSIYILTGVSDRTRENLFSAAIIGAMLILLYWLLFQYSINGAFLRFSFIGNRWSLVFFAGFLLAIERFNERKVRPVIVYSLMLVGLVVMMASYSRTALMVYIGYVGLRVFYIIGSDFSRQKSIIYFALIILLLISFFIWGDSFIFFLNGKWGNDAMSESLLIRLDMWKNLFSEFRILGFSTSDFQYQYLTGTYNVSNFHNTYVQAYTYGAVALVMYIWINILGWKSVMSIIHVKKNNLAIQMGGYCLTSHLHF